MIKGYEYQTEFARKYFGQGIEQRIEEGHEQGLKQGRQEGQEGIIRVLVAFMGAQLPGIRDELERRLRDHSSARLLEIASELGTAYDEAAVRAVLDRHLLRCTLCPIVLPPAVEELVECLAAMPGAVAVVLGGSRAAGGSDAESDWDLGVYYRGSIDTSALAARATVHPPGAWGRIMNGGAWLTCAGLKVDVLLRDLDVVEHWSAHAEEGQYEVDGLLGYLAGIPTYSLLAERAVARVLRGALAEAGPFPARLSETAPERWRFHGRFNLAHARMRARRGDAVGTLGQAARAVVEHAHAILCERRAWVLNEKQIVRRAGLDAAEALFAAGAPGDLVDWLDAVERALA